MVFYDIHPQTKKFLMCIIKKKILQKLMKSVSVIDMFFGLKGPDIS